MTTPPTNKSAPGTKRKSSSCPSTTTKPSRAQPSVPLHMITRKRNASKSASMNSVVSSGGSRANSNKNKSCLETEHAAASGDLVTQGPPKRRRLTDQHASADRQQTSPPLKLHNKDTKGVPSIKTTVVAKRKSNSESIQVEDEEEIGEHGAISSTEAGTADDSSKAASSVTPRIKFWSQRLGASNPKSIDASVSSASRAELASVAKTKRPPGRPRGRPKRHAIPRLVPPKVTLRLPGRRRADLDAKLREDLLRQAALKKNYRTLVRLVKPSLCELGERTQQELEDNERAHEFYPQFRQVQRELDRRLRIQLESIEVETRLKKDQRTIMLEGERAIIEQGTQRQFDDIREDHLARCKAEHTRIVRRIRGDEDDTATEDEDVDLVRGEKLAVPVRGTSRSCLLRDTQRSWEQDQSRARLGAALATFAPETVELGRSRFALFDAHTREAGLAHENMERLSEAVEFVEEAARLAEAAAIENERSAGLRSLLEVIQVVDEKKNAAPIQTQEATPKRINRTAGRKKQDSQGKPPVTPQRVRRGDGVPPESVSRAGLAPEDVTQEPKRPSTSDPKRTEPKLGLFMTPPSKRPPTLGTSREAFESKLYGSPVISPRHVPTGLQETPSRSSVAALNRVIQHDPESRPKPKPNPQRTASLANILNYDEPTVIRPRADVEPRSIKTLEQSTYNAPIRPLQHYHPPPPPMPPHLAYPTYSNPDLSSAPSLPSAYGPQAGPSPSRYQPYQDYKPAGPAYYSTPAPPSQRPLVTAAQAPAPASLSTQVSAPPASVPRPPAQQQTYTSPFPSSPIGHAAAFAPSGQLPGPQSMYPAAPVAPPYANRYAPPEAGRPFYGDGAYFPGRGSLEYTFHPPPHGPLSPSGFMHPHPRSGPYDGIRDMRPISQPPAPPPAPPPQLYISGYQQYTPR